MSFYDTFNKEKESSESNDQQYAMLTQLFLFRAAELIYGERCPDALSDFVLEDQPSFLPIIHKSESLRQIVSQSHLHGWFSIDIILLGTNVVIERWILKHEKNNAQFDFSSVKEIRSNLYRKYSQMIRGIFSILQSMPANTLKLTLSRMPSTSRHISASCSHFVSNCHSIPPLQSTNSTSTIEFKPIFSPIGKCCISCEFLSSIDSLVPMISTNASINLSTYKFNSVTETIASRSGQSCVSGSLDLNKEQISRKTNDACDSLKEMNLGDFETYINDIFQTVSFSNKSSNEKVKRNLNILESEFPSLNDLISVCP